MSELAPVVVFAEPYGPEPSGVQPLIERLLGRRRVVWFNVAVPDRAGSGLGRFRAGLGPLGRRARRFFEPSGRSSAAGADRLRVIDLPVQPGEPPGWGGTARHRRIAECVRRVVDRLPRTPVVLTTVPHTAGLIDAFPARRWVYYMVKDHAVAARSGVAELEAEQLRRVDAVAAVSEGLGQRGVEAGHEPLILPPGVDPEWWAPAEIEAPRSRAAHRLAGLPEPRALYWGPPGTELDPQLLQALADRWAGSIGLIGPGRSRGHALSAIRGVHCLGPAPERDLPRIATLADVLILPLAAERSESTGLPVQLLPYLATGRATVCREGPGLRRWAACCDVVGPERFADRVAQRAVTGPSAEQLIARQRLLASESWEARVDRLEALLDAAEPVIRVHPSSSVMPLPPRTAPPTAPRSADRDASSR